MRKRTFALKTWPAERFAAVVDQLAVWRPDAVFFIIGAPEDVAQANEVRRAAKTSITNFCGRTKVAEIASVLEKTDLLVTVDTGATHIAACVGLPMVVVYGCTTPKCWRPINSRAAVVTTEEPCCPCSLPEDGCSHKRCLDNISVEMVLEKINEIMNWANGKERKQ